MNSKLLVLIAGLAPLNGYAKESPPAPTPANHETSAPLKASPPTAAPMN